jgi:hypothetical protein
VPEGWHGIKASFVEGGSWRNQIMGLGWDTNQFTKPVVVRVYKGSETSKMESELGELLQHGYTIASQTGTGSHVNVGRTVTGAVLTGGLSLLFGGSRSKEKITLTFVKQPSSQPSTQSAPKKLFKK